MGKLRPRRFDEGGRAKSKQCVTSWAWMEEKKNPGNAKEQQIKINATLAVVEL